jgi:uracil-DNA glycosylase
MVKIEESWEKALGNEFEKPYFKKLSDFVHSEYVSGKTYPLPKNIFRAFELCPFDKVKVVIIGQDPYHGPQQANGLCFAVSEGIRLPPSLKNIYKEIAEDLKKSIMKKWWQRVGTCRGGRSKVFYS